MARGRGANALLAMLFEASYGVNPGGDGILMPFLTSTLGGEAKLIEDTTLGYGRGERDHLLDALDVGGDLEVPHDTRYIGYWLKAFLGAPTTAASVAAANTLTFSAQPADNATITLNGTVWTFVSGAPAGTQIQKGATLALTMAAADTALNASADVQTAKNTYTHTATTLTATSDTLGPDSNTYTVAASATANATLPAADGSVGTSATLIGGANTHTFIDGALALPSQCLEIGMPDVPSFALMLGKLLNTMKFSMGRTGLAQATLSFIGQNELPPAAATQLGTPAAPFTGYTRFAQKMGEVRLNGTQIGSLDAGDLELSNNFDTVPGIRGDGLIEGADAAQFTGKGTATVRFKDHTLLNAAIAGAPVSLAYNYARSPSEKIAYTLHRAFLPRPKRRIDGLAGIKAQFDWMASRDPALNKTLTVTLTNDVVSY